MILSKRGENTRAQMIVRARCRVCNVRRYLWIEVILFVPLLAFAAAIARGYGEF